VLSRGPKSVKPTDQKIEKDWLEEMNSVRRINVVAKRTTKRAHFELSSVLSANPFARQLTSFSDKDMMSSNNSNPPLVMLILLFLWQSHSMCQDGVNIIIINIFSFVGHPFSFLYFTGFL
jgi:hypothetical protein